jgi:3-isopropylmalate/(R)-2-methylmalate dehydratase small subunit
MSEHRNSGKAWVLGDDVNTDVLAPGLYMKDTIDVLASHCLEAVEPDFANSVAEGDVIVAGENFGIGSSREQAAQVLKMLGVEAVVAKSFGGIFFRNALNFGLAAVVSPDIEKIQPGDQIAVDVEAGKITNTTQGQTCSCEVLPPPLLSILRDGGLVPHLKKRFIHSLPEGRSK